jgi:hypothetical protein
VNKLTGVSLLIGAALVFCFAGQAQAGWSALAASRSGLEASLPVISVKDKKKHHDGDHQGKSARNKKQKNHNGEQSNSSTDAAQQDSQSGGADSMGWKYLNLDKNP